jgi:hypothetical protein
MLIAQPFLPDPLLLCAHGCCCLLLPPLTAGLSRIMTHCLCWQKSLTLWASDSWGSRCTPSGQQQVRALDPCNSSSKSAAGLRVAV